MGVANVVASEFAEVGLVRGGRKPGADKLIDAIAYLGEGGLGQAVGCHDDAVAQESVLLQRAQHALTRPLGGAHVAVMNGVGDAH